MSAGEPNSATNKNDESHIRIFGNKLIIKHILNRLEYPDIESLRKVSRLLRETISKFNRVYEFITYKIALRNIGKLNVTFSVGSSDVDIHYMETEQGCSVGRSMKNSVSIPEDFRLVCLKDFEATLRQRTSYLKDFTISSSYKSYFEEKLENVDYAEMEDSTDQFLEVFEYLFKSNGLLIQTGLLFIEATSEKDVMSVLPYVDPKFLTWININIANANDEQRIIDLHSKIIQLEQWKKNKHLYIHRSLVVSTPIQEISFSQFIRGGITFNNVTSEDMRYLKEEFLKSPTLIKFKVNFTNCDIDDTLLLLMGWPHVVANPLLRNQKTIWFFPIPNTERFLRIVYHVPQSAVFIHCSSENVPDEVLFRN